MAIGFRTNIADNSNNDILQKQAFPLFKHSVECWMLSFLQPGTIWSVHTTDTYLPPDM